MLPSDLIAALEAPGEYPGSCGSRNISDNLSDLKAQVAANQKVANCLCVYTNSGNRAVSVSDLIFHILLW